MLVLTTAAFSQNCSRVKSAIFTGPFLTLGKPDSFKLTINYTTYNGQKSLQTVIFCSGIAILTDCFSDNNNDGIKIYTVACDGGLAKLSAIFTPKTGSCAATNCDDQLPPQTIPEGGVTLPVKLSSFTAVRSKQVVSINWNTEFEIDAKEFIVERAEGTEFRSVGAIPSNGNSNTTKSYSFNDKNENVGNTYYRLKNVDLNGKFTYSQIRTVKGYGVADDVTVFPNPARSNSKISLNGVAANSSIQLIDFSGKVLRNINSTTVNSLDLSGVKNGTYLIRIVDRSSNEIVNKKLTVTN